MELKIIPYISEKTYAHSTNGVYTFKVPKVANKLSVAEAVAKQFNVKVESVNVIIRKGKVKQTYRKGGKPVIGRLNDSKKAYVKLAKGEKIAAFEQKEAK